jgi:hypothetical protein
MVFIFVNICIYSFNVFIGHTHKTQLVNIRQFVLPIDALLDMKVPSCGLSECDWV